MDERVSVILIEALANAWSKIRSRHPTVPGVVLLAAPAARDRQNVLGHFAALRWRTKAKGEKLFHEVVVVAEHLDRPAEEIMETLLHEAAHAMNFELGVRDCSASQYHNKYFRLAARALGLEVTQVQHYGYALTSLPLGTAKTYEEEINILRVALICRRGPGFLVIGTGGSLPPRDGNDGDGRSSSRSRKAVCGCPFIIRVSRKTLDNTTIRCESCGQEFRLA